MFDPNFIGKVDPDAVEVEEVFDDPRRCQRFRAVVSLQGHRHLLLLKPNADGYRDRIVADRLKYLFDLRPMHVFGLALNFAYRGGKRIAADWLEYVAISLGSRVPRSLLHLPCRVQTLDKIRGTPLFEQQDFQVEFCKVVMFRYVIGTGGTQDEHILVHTVEGEEGGLPRHFEIVSISENGIGSQCPSRDFLDSLRCINPFAWKAAQSALQKHFDYDYERGIILQTRQAEREIKWRRPKGLLRVKAKRITDIIEDRFGLITTCPAEEVLSQMSI